ncbi:hypothetical protein PHYBOEH_010466 [Phytophthora boehmeriae]|uniref:RxLR effector protein n=1 Tax=Phytophthora boehmeriae TaxID=109152 RepID=A0A8T1VQH2_9STRA|nr:hypothetical protein PHYBOEH_010466 [Phytophthora boehmeriae]
MSGVLSVASVSTEASPNPVRAITADYKRLLRVQDDADDEERVSFLGFLKNSFKKSNKKSKSVAGKNEKHLPSAEQLAMMPYSDDITYSFFKSWTDMKLPLTTVARIVKGDKDILKSFLKYQATLNAAKALR